MGGVVSFVGAPQSIGAANGGKIYANNGVGTSNVQVAPANPNRRSIIFHNPGTVNLYVSMTTQVSQAGVGAPLVPSPAALGGTFLIYPGGLLTFQGGEIQLVWQAFAASGTNPITVMDSNA
jgi:hypothetical protein